MSEEGWLCPHCEHLVELHSWDARCRHTWQNPASKHPRTKTMRCACEWRPPVTAPDAPPDSSR